MKVKLYVGTNCDDYRTEEMYVYDNEDKQVGSEYVYPLHECPEDACIERDLLSCSTIIDYMKLAYEAGKNGEELTIEEFEAEED